MEKVTLPAMLYGGLLNFLEFASISRVPLSGVFRGGGQLCDRPPWSDREFLDNFCNTFVALFRE